MAKKPATAARSIKPAASLGGHGHDDTPTSSMTSIPSGMDYAAHEAMYHRFTNIAKWGIVACAVLVIFLFISIHPMVPTAAS
jgi:hypothetical protein